MGKKDQKAGRSRLQSNETVERTREKNVRENNSPKSEHYLGQQNPLPTGKEKESKVSGQPSCGRPLKQLAGKHGRWRKESRVLRENLKDQGSHLSPGRVGGREKCPKSYK